MKGMQRTGAAVALVLAGLASGAAARDVGFATVHVAFRVVDRDARDSLGHELARVQTEVSRDLARSLGEELRHIRFDHELTSGADLSFVVEVRPEVEELAHSHLAIGFELAAHPRTRGVPRTWHTRFMTIDELALEGFGELDEFERRLRGAVGLEVDERGEPTAAARELRSVLFDELFRHVRLVDGADHVASTRCLVIRKRRDDARIPAGSIFDVRIAFDDPAVGVDELTCRARLLTQRDLAERSDLDPALERVLVAFAADDLHETPRELEHVRRLETSPAAAGEVFLARLSSESESGAVSPLDFDPGGPE